MRQFTTEDEYQAFFARVEASFAPQDMTQASLADWLNNATLAETFSLTREIWLQVSEATTLEELNDLQRDARTLIIHKERVLDLIDAKAEQIRIVEREQVIAESEARGIEFARLKKITLSERTVFREEIWSGRRVQVIRTRGRFRAWKII